jgi:PAS domain S-box-containing protein
MKGTHAGSWLFRAQTARKGFALHDSPQRLSGSQKQLIAAAYAVIALGLLVMVGWLIGSLTLVRLVRGGNPMVFNTAVCFVVAGLGYWSAAMRWRGWARICGLLLVVVSAITFLQFPLGQSLGIDELFMRQRLNVDLSGPGRMAPNTAVAFFIAGVSLFCMSAGRVWARAVVVLAAILLAIGFLSLCGYVTGLRAAFSWGRFTGMALHTTIAFVVLGLGQIRWGSAEWQKHLGGRGKSLPFFISGGAIMVVLSAVVYVSSESEKTTAEWVHHTDKVIETLGQIGEAIAFAESAQRGYVLSGDDEFLEGYAQRCHDIPGQVALLGRLVADNPAHLVRVPALAGALQRKIAFMDEGIQLRATESGDHATRLVVGGRGREIMREIEDHIESMKEAERALRAQRMADCVYSEKQLRGVLLLGGGLVFLLFTIAFLVTARAEAGQAAAQRELLAVNQNLESRVVERTAALEKARRASQEAEQRLRAVLSNSPIILWAIDRNGIYTVSEGRGLMHLGLRPGQAVGCSQFDATRDEPELAAHTRRALEGEAFTADAKYRDRWYETHFTPVRNNLDEVTGVVAISTDITSRKEAERLAMAELGAREASRLKSEFLASMSHEIRTPMNGIIGMSALLMDTSLSAEQREMGQVIQNSAEGLLGIINDILDFSKIEAGKLRLDPVEFDLRQMVDETLALLAPRAHEKGVELICDFDVELPTSVRGDGGRIRQILTNLAGNAIKFTEKGEVVVTTRITRLTDETVGFAIEVKDSGVGIPEQVQSRLFHAFVQGDDGTARKFGGTGLGLTISRQLVELMNGKIGFESTAGRGSTFWFQLELQRTAGGAGFSTAPFGVSGRVLVVDDNPTNRRILVAQLGKLGLAVDAVSSPTDAIEALMRADAVEPYRLALLDWRMPEMSGLELAKHLRKESRTKAMPLLILSSDSGDTTECSKINVPCLTKPVRAAQLRRAVFEALGGVSKPVLKTVSRIGKASVVLDVLLADDNRVNQTVGRRILEKMGHRVDVAQDGRAVLNALRARSYDVVLMDCQMPEMDGFETTARIRGGEAGEQRAKTPIIALTAYAMPADRLKCLAAGMNEYLSKPLRVEDISAVLTRFSRSSQVGSSDCENAPGVLGVAVIE